MQLDSFTKNISEAVHNSPTINKFIVWVDNKRKEEAEHISICYLSFDKMFPIQRLAPLEQQNFDNHIYVNMGNNPIEHHAGMENAMPMKEEREPRNVDAP